MLVTIYAHVIRITEGTSVSDANPDLLYTTQSLNPHLPAHMSSRSSHHSHSLLHASPGAQACHSYSLLSQPPYEFPSYFTSHMQQYSKKRYCQSSATPMDRYRTIYCTQSLRVQQAILPLKNIKPKLSYFMNHSAIPNPQQSLMTQRCIMQPSTRANIKEVQPK